MDKTNPEKCIYIAGPMSGCVDNNKTAFYNAETELLLQGYLGKNIFNPAVSEESHMVHMGLIHGQKAYRVCLKADLDWICDYADEILMLKGWEYSPGANAEHALAKALQIKILYEQ